MTLVQQLVLNSWIFLVIPSSWLCSRLNYVAAVVDIGSYFVKATYNLEGDGILAVKCYEEILKIRAAISAPNLQAVSQESSSGNPALQQQLIAHGISCIQPGLLYFQEKLGSDTVHLP